MESMKLSPAHKNFAEQLGKPDALENPQDYLGPNTSTVLNFWLYLDKLDKEQWKIVGERYYAAWDAARDAARDAAQIAADYAAWGAAFDAARDAARGAARGAAAWATYELMGSHILLEQGKSLLFVTMFDFTKKEGIDFSKIRPKFVMTSTPTTSDIFPNYHSGRCQLLSVPDTTRHIFPIRNPCLEIEMPQE